MAKKKSSSGGVIIEIFKAIGMLYFYIFKGIFWIFKGIGLGIKKLIEFVLKLSPDEQHKLSVGFQWLFSLTFIAIGFFGISSSGIAMAFMMLLGLALNPRFCDFLNKKLKNKNIVIDAPKRIAIGIVSFVLMCTFLPKGATQPQETPQETPTMVDNVQETTISTTEITTLVTTKELELGFSFDDSLYEKIFKEIYPFGYDERVSVDTQKKMNVANKYDITVSEVTEIINYFKDGKNKDISYIVVKNPTGTTVSTTAVTTVPTTVSATTTTTTEKKTKQVKQTQSQIKTYVLNTSTHKFHISTCRDVGKIKEENYSTFNGSRDEIIGMGYEPCKHCNP